MYINLLPFDYLRRQLVRRRLAQWSIVWTVVLGVMLVICWIDHAEYTTMSKQLATQRQQYAPIAQLKREMNTLRAQLNDVQQREAIMLRLAERRPVLTVLGVISAATRRCDGHVSVSALAVSTTPNGTRDDRNCVVGVEGLADNDASISRFATALRNHGIFRQVALKNTDDQQVSGTKVRSYSIDCTY